MTKAAKVEVTIFNNMQEADEAINKKLEKIKSLVGKKQKEINAKYDAELAALEKQTPSGIKETTPNVEGDWSKDVESTAKALEKVEKSKGKAVVSGFLNEFTGKDYFRIVTGKQNGRAHV